MTSPSPSSTGIAQAVGHGGMFCVQQLRYTPYGYIPLEEECGDNVLMDAGDNYTINLLLAESSGAVDYVAVGNGTDPSADTTATTLNAEITDQGLARAQGTALRDYSGATLNASMNKVFTYTGSGSCVVNSTALLNASSAGTIFIADDFTDRTLQQNDKLNITAYFWAS